MSDLYITKFQSSLPPCTTISLFLAGKKFFNRFRNEGVTDWFYSIIIIFQYLKQNKNVFPIDIFCRAHSDCSAQQACINKKCQNPCTVTNPCTVSQDCQVQNHQPVCVKGIFIVYVKILKLRIAFKLQYANARKIRIAEMVDIDVMDVNALLVSIIQHKYSIFSLNKVPISPPAFHFLVDSHWSSNQPFNILSNNSKNVIHCWRFTTHLFEDVTTNDRKCLF